MIVVAEYIIINTINSDWKPCDSYQVVLSPTCRGGSVFGPFNWVIRTQRYRWFFFWPIGPRGEMHECITSGIELWYNMYNTRSIKGAFFYTRVYCIYISNECKSHLNKSLIRPTIWPCSCISRSGQDPAVGLQYRRATFQSNILLILCIIICTILYCNICHSYYLVYTHIMCTQYTSGQWRCDFSSSRKSHQKPTNVIRTPGDEDIAK